MEQKGPKELFGTNLPHILRLTQVEEAVRLNKLWKELTTASKLQQFLALEYHKGVAIEHEDLVGDGCYHV